MAGKETTDGKPWLLWIATALLFVWFLFQGLAKVTAMEMMVESWETWGHPPWAMYLVGIVELVGAALLLIRRTAFIGAVGLLLIMPGAAVTHILAAEWGAIAIPVVTAMLLAFVAWRRRPAGVQAWLSERRARASRR